MGVAVTWWRGVISKPARYMMLISAVALEGCNTVCCSFSKRRGLARAAQSAAEGAERNKEQTAAQMMMMS